MSIPDGGQAASAPKPASTPSAPVAIGSVVMAVLMLLVGIILQAAFGDKAALCNSGFGALAQEVGGVSTQASCAGVNLGDTLGVTFTWIGAIGLALMALIFVLSQLGGSRGAR